MIWVNIRENSLSNAFISLAKKERNINFNAMSLILIPM